MFSIIDTPNGPKVGNSPSGHRTALMKGFEKLGVEHIVINNGAFPKTKKIVCWGWRKGAAYRNTGAFEVLVMERGYIGDRFSYTSLGWNGLNNYATFPEYPDDGGARFRAHGGVLKPWKTGGKYAVILGQVKGDASLKGQDISPWYAQTAEEIRQFYDIPVYFRPHPDCMRRGGYHSVDGCPKIDGTLQEVLDGALFTVAYNSNSCLDSVLSGVPCYAGDKGTMAWDLCMKDIKKIVMPDREKVVNAIAWKQWTTEEIESGEALKRLVEV